MKELLFTPLTLGTTQLPNRIVFTAHRTNFGRKGQLNDRHIAYYRRRAQGGCGLIVLGELSIHPNDQPWESMIHAWRPETIDELKKLTDAVHSYDTRIFLQLNHHGFQSSGAISRQAVWGPSAVADVMFGETAKVMEDEDMAELVEAFCRAADLSRTAGFDGVEIDMGSESLLRQFLSPISNHRQDAYGGRLENRMHLPLQVVEGVRRTVGADYTVGVRLCMDEQFWGGITPEESNVFAEKFESKGIVDYIQVCLGTYYNLYLVRGTMHVPTGSPIELASQLKERIQLPVIAGHQAGFIASARKAVDKRRVDALGFMRALIADPDVPNKTRDGQIDLIRRCVRDNKGCIGRINQNKSIGCVQNAVAGREPLNPSNGLKPAPKAKKILVVGGGPAGMETARVAAERGHHVTLYEQEAVLGGQTNLHQIAAGREKVAHVTDFLQCRLAALDVAVITATQVTPELVTQLNPDAVVIATGSAPVTHPYPGTYSPPDVVTVWDVLQQRHPIGEQVLFIDEIGGHYATATVEYLANQGKKILLLSWDLFVGVEVAPLGDLYLSRQRLLQKGVRFQTDMAVDEIQGRQVQARNIYTNKTEIFTHHDTVVVAAGNYARQDLYIALKGCVRELYCIGDCIAPRGIDMAVLEAAKVGELL